MLLKKLEGLFGAADATVASKATRLFVPTFAGVLLAAVLAVSTSSQETARLFDNIHWTLGYFGAAVLGLLGARCAAPADRLPKRWFAWALATYLLGQLLWDIQVASGWNPFPGPSDLFFVCLGPMTGIGLVLLLLERASGTERRTALLDGAGLTVAVLALTLALYLPRRGGLHLLQISFLVAYPVFLCWAACTALTAVLTLHLVVDRGLVLFLVGLFGNAALWLHWNSLTLDNALADGTVSNTLFSFCALAQGTGALLLRFEAGRSKSWERFCEHLRRLLPLLLVVVCAAAVVFAYTLPGTPAPVRWSALFGGLVVVILATVRQSVLLEERERLIVAERELRRAEETFRALVEQAADGIFLTDLRGIYLDVNTSGAQMLGMTRQEVIGKCIADLVVAEERGRIEPQIVRLLQGETITSTWTFLRKDGSPFTGEVLAKQLSDGRLQGFVRDVSDRLALEAQLRQSQKMEAIGVLAAGIAHDFNNVLSAIRGNAALVAEDLGADHPDAEFVADIEFAAKRASALVQRILAFSRPRPPTTERVDLGALVTEVVKLLRPTLPASVELKVVLDAPSPIIVADPSQLEQALMNLSTNAWHAMNGKPGAIEFRLTRARVRDGQSGLDLPVGNYARLEVIDNGQGMSSATLERIFDPFFTTKAPGEGSGLGLSLVHGTVQTHRGALRVKSRPGEGSTFSLYFPTEVDEPPTLSPPSSAKWSAPQRPSTCRLAYVDDEAQLVAVTPRQLNRRGYQVQSFQLPKEVLEVLNGNPEAFDIIVTDYSMPGMSGLELIRAARELNPKLGFVITSGYVSDELRETAAEFGVLHLIKKPALVDELCCAIEEVVARTRVSRSPT